ncbi:MAG: cation:proton antiporter [Cyanobacteriota bacterium]|nr:cation:proton antiporter [Cyanobacteriota bacterium]
MAAFLAASPLATFALLLAISVLVPPLIRRLGLPDLVGLLAAGVLLGPHALGWLSEGSPTVRLLADVGVIYLLFIAGLEIDLAQFQRIRQRSFRFGLLTFSLPMAAGAVLALAFGYPALSAVLIGSILASHTPLGYPIVRSYGAIREESVTVAIGGTIFTDIAALLVLALCMGVARGDLSGASVAVLLLKIAVYGTLVVLLITRFGRVLVQRSVNSDSQLFVAVLLALFASALGAGVAGVEKIVGAFLAGLAVNAVLPDGRVKEQVVFVGATLFIPVFFIDLGLLLDLPVFAATMVGSAFAVALIATLIASKGLASWWAGRLYGYTGPQMLTLWSLSLPQVAATLAATFVGFRAGVLDERMLNSVLALMVVTATLGPWLTGVAMPRLAEAAAAGFTADQGGQLALVRRALRVLVPIANPEHQSDLMALASLLSCGDEGNQGRLLPLAVVSPRQVQATGRADKELLAAISTGRGQLQQAVADLAPGSCPSQPLLRVDGDVAAAIARSALEQGADLVLMGMGEPARLGRWLFGDLVDATCRQTHCPLVVARLLAPPLTLQRLLVPVKDLTAAALEQFQLAERIASAVGGAVTLLHLHDPRLSALERGQLAAQLECWRPQANASAADVPVEILLLPNHGVESGIHRASQDHDLVILRSQRRLVAGLPIAASDRTSCLLRLLESSVLVISDPLH